MEPEREMLLIELQKEKTKELIKKQADEIKEIIKGASLYGIPVDMGDADMLLVAAYFYYQNNKTYENRNP